jgi:hypothetical protein
MSTVDIRQSRFQSEPGSKRLCSLQLASLAHVGAVLTSSIKKVSDDDIDYEHEDLGDSWMVVHLVNFERDK